MADPPILAGALRRHDMAFVAMSELWKWPIVGLIVWLLGYIPIKRGDKKSAERMMKRSRRVLRALGLLGIFPEGKCSKDAKVLPLKSGTTDLAFETMTSVLVVGIRGTEQVWPLNSWKVNRKAQVTVAFGWLLEPQEYLNFCKGDVDEAKKLFTTAMKEGLEMLSEAPLDQLHEYLTGRKRVV